MVEMERKRCYIPSQRKDLHSKILQGAGPVTAITAQVCESNNLLGGITIAASWYQPVCTWKEAEDVLEQCDLLLMTMEGITLLLRWCDVPARLSPT